MNSFMFWFLLSIVLGAVLFTLGYFYDKWECKKKDIESTNKNHLQIASAIGLWPIAACLTTWIGIWLNL